MMGEVQEYFEPILKTELSDDFPYADIFYSKRHVSSTHPRMDILNRAAQFMPFDALTGFDEAVSEVERYTDVEHSLGDYDIEDLNAKLSFLKAQGMPDETVSITSFVPDPTKEGGHYERVEGSIKRIDDVEQKIILSNGHVLLMRYIKSIDGEVFAHQM